MRDARTLWTNTLFCPRRERIEGVLDTLEKAVGFIDSIKRRILGYGADNDSAQLFNRPPARCPGGGKKRRKSAPGGGAY
jgi:hypothetical protein